ncbi:MAG: hypothetical protein J5547_02060, partial [Clostridia bacterium]|nr:hypothetical protein [Clostridia bacterium]
VYVADLNSEHEHAEKQTASKSKHISAFFIAFSPERELSFLIISHHTRFVKYNRRPFFAQNLYAFLLKKYTKLLHFQIKCDIVMMYANRNE